MRLSNQILNLLGLANRSRNLVTGENVVKSVRNETSFLVIYAADASDATKKRLLDKCSYYHIECLEFGTIDSISKAIGKDNRVCVSIINKGFAAKLIENIRRLNDGKENKETCKEE